MPGDNVCRGGLDQRGRAGERAATFEYLGALGALSTVTARGCQSPYRGQPRPLPGASGSASVDGRNTFPAMIIQLRLIAPDSSHLGVVLDRQQACRLRRRANPEGD